MNQRKSQYIDPEVQGALARRLTGHWCLFIAIASVLVVGLQWMHDPFQPIGSLLANAASTYGPLLLILACLAPVFVYDSIKLSNRFTGPMLRFRRVLKELATGQQVEPIKLRTNDFWQDVAEDLNNYAKSVQDKSPELSQDPRD